MAQAKPKRGYATDVVKRLLETLMLIHREGKIAPRRIAGLLAEDGMEVDYRTTQRDLARLEEAGYLVRKGRDLALGRRWSNSETRKILGLPFGAALALKLAYEHVKPLMPASLLKELKAIADSAEKSLSASIGRNPFAKWPDKIRVLQSGPLRTPPNIKPGVHEAVCDALLNNLQLRVRYRAASKQDGREFIITPLGMVSKDGKIYVVVSRADKAEPAKFALNRILNAQVEHIEGNAPSAWAGLDAYIDAGKLLFPPGKVEKNQLVTLRINSDVIARDLEEMPIGAGQIIKKKGNAGTNGNPCHLVQARVTVSEEFVRWLLQHGEHVNVIKPIPLRKRMQEIVKRLHSRYEDI